MKKDYFGLTVDNIVNDLLQSEFLYCVMIFSFSVYTYVVRAKTNVNGRIVTVSTPDVSVNVGEVAPTASKCIYL